MYRYSLYGLTVGSAFPLPELAPVATSATTHSIDLHIAEGDCDTPGTALPDLLARYDPNDATLQHPQFGACCVQDGTRIMVQRRANTQLAELRPIILGAALGLALAQRGHTLLHGSTVALDDKGYTFVGNKGMGKSVMTASLVHRGDAATLVSDDITVMARDTATPQALRGASFVRLHPDSLRNMGEDPTTLPMVHPASPKRIWQVPHFTEAGRIPLCAIVVLDRGEQLRLTPCDAVQAFTEVLPHYYLSRWPQIVHGSVDHFIRITRLVQDVSVFHLSYTDAHTEAKAIIQLLQTATS